MTREEFQQLLAEGLKPINEEIAALKATAKGTETAAATAQASAADDKIVKLFEEKLKPITDTLAKMQTEAGISVKAQAKAAVAKHVARGAIAPADTKSIEFWEGAVLANAAAAEEQMGRLAGKTFSRIIHGSGGTESATAGGEPEQVFMARAKVFGEAHKIAGEAETLAAYGRTAEGQELYSQFRSKMVKK